MSALVNSIINGEECILVFGADTPLCFIEDSQLTVTGDVLQQLLRLGNGLHVYLEGQHTNVQQVLASPRVQQVDFTSGGSTQDLLNHINAAQVIGVCGVRFNNSSLSLQLLQRAASPSVTLICFTPSVFIRQLHQKSVIRPEIGEGELATACARLQNVVHSIGDINDTLPLLLWQARELLRTMRVFEMANLNRRGNGSQSKVAPAKEITGTKPSEGLRLAGDQNAGWELAELVWNTHNGVPASMLDEIDAIFRPRRYEISTSLHRTLSDTETPRKRKGLHSPFSAIETSPRPTVSHLKSPSRLETSHKRSHLSSSSSYRDKMNAEDETLITSVAVAQLPRWCREEIELKHPSRRKARVRKSRVPNDSPDEIDKFIEEFGEHTPQQSTPRSKLELLQEDEQRATNSAHNDILTTPPRRSRPASADLDAAAALIFMQSTDSHP